MVYHKATSCAYHKKNTMNPFIVGKQQDDNFYRILKTVNGVKLADLYRDLQNTASKLRLESSNQPFSFFENVESKQAKNIIEALNQIKFWLSNTSDDAEEENLLLQYSVNACTILNDALAVSGCRDAPKYDTYLQEITALINKIPENRENIKNWGIFTAILVPFTTLFEITFFLFEILAGYMPLILTTMLVDYSYFAFNKPIEPALKIIETIITDMKNDAHPTPISDNFNKTELMPVNI